MLKYPSVVLAACVLAACSGNPFDKTEPQPAPPPAPPAQEPAPPPEEPAGITGRGLATGTIVPAPDRSIVRFEERSEEAGNGAGYANNFRYTPPTSDGGGDVFYVEGLPFDDNQPEGTPYTRAVNPSTNENVELGASFAAYEGPATTRDFVTDTEIRQFDHKAIYGTSPSGNSRLAIVRTGSYAGYGFGGFVYQRDGGVVLPTSGQATYSGDYAGLRDFNGAGGLEYVTGDMTVDIDFNGFSGNCTTPACTNAVRGAVTNRRVFDMQGNELTEALAGFIADGRTTLPTLRFQIGTGAMDANGEITGIVSSTVGGDDYEAGRYYAVMSGDHTTGGEIVGIIVVEAEDPRAENVSVRETGGFIVTRQ